MKKSVESMHGAEDRQELPTTPTALKAAATKDIAAMMNGILADEFALYLKTKHFHWRMSGPHFRDYHQLLDGHGDQPFEANRPGAPIGH